MSIHKHLPEEFRDARLKGLSARVVYRGDPAARLFYRVDANAASVVERRVVSLLRTWLDEARRRDQRSSFMCVGCDVEFFGSRLPEALLIVLPYADVMRHTMTLGICKRCSIRGPAAVFGAIQKVLRRSWHSGPAAVEPEDDWH
jgi:hypothetical protein